MADYTQLATPYNVLLKRGSFVDESRGAREISWKLYYPANYTGGKIPVIVWSHGYGGNKDGAGFIARHIAGNGYVVIHPTHPGSDSSVWEGKEGHPWDVLRKTPITRGMTIERFRDIPFLLDQLSGWAAANPDVGAVMDLNMLGMSGHSFGAMTTQAMAGQKFQNEEGALEDFCESRFTACIAYSPVPIRKLVAEAPEKYLYGPIGLPVFYMTGTQDDSPLEGFTYDRRVVIYDFTGNPEKYLLILNDGDHMVYNGTRGKLEVNPLREKHEDIIKAFSLVFWDAYLKKDSEAMAWLKAGGAAEWLGNAGILRAPKEL